MATKKKKPRSLKQDLIWKSGGMIGHLGCGKSNINNAVYNARRVLGELKEMAEDQEDIKDLEILRTDFLEVCQDLSLVLSRFTVVIRDVHSTVQEKINRIPKNDNTPSL